MFHVEKMHGYSEAYMTIKDSNGTELQNGDNVTVIKDLKVKGSSDVLKRGTQYKGIRHKEKHSNPLKFNEF